MTKTNFQVVGLDTLKKQLDELVPAVAVRAGKTGTAKAAAYLRTQVRRSMPKPVKKWFGVKAIKSVRLKRPIDGGKTVGARVTAPNIFIIWEHGRRAVTTKTGVTRRASPQMKRFAFFWGAVETNGERAVQNIIDYTKAQLVNEAVKIYKKTASERPKP